MVESEKPPKKDKAALKEEKFLLQGKFKEEVQVVFGQHGVHIVDSKDAPIINWAFNKQMNPAYDALISKSLGERIWDMSLKDVANRTGNKVSGKEAKDWAENYGDPRYTEK